MTKRKGICQQRFCVMRAAWFIGKFDLYLNSTKYPIYSPKSRTPQQPQNVSRNYIDTTMMTFDQAKKIVNDRLTKIVPSTSNDSLIIVDELTIEKPYAWIFTYTSILWLETKDDKYAIAGNAPIIIDKQTGKQTSYSTAYDMTSIIDKYEEEQKIWSLDLADLQTLNNDKLLVLKSKLNFDYDRLLQLKNREKIILDKGSELRLSSLKNDLQKIGIETRLSLSWHD
ncbi:MAG: hypothetical protein JNL95_11260 [Chitinophagales bacterium]|nr:hypothetical protein [Chitinophagales bacterium]